MPRATLDTPTLLEMPEAPPQTPEAPPPRRGRETRTGILPCQELKSLIEDGVLSPESPKRPIEPGQLQPASLDLRLGPKAYRVQASFLPGAAATVAEKIEEYSMHEFDLGEGAVLEKDCVYIVKLEERIKLPHDMEGLANPKSSTGRLDIFTRLIVDNATGFDRIPGAYHGPLYAEIVPRTFSILVRPGSRLCQLRLKRGVPRMPNTEIRRLQDNIPLVEGPSDAAPIREDRIAVTLDLEGDIAGFRARRHTGVIDVDRRDGYRPEDFWEPVTPRAGGLVLDPHDFYILATRERVRIPPEVAAEMVAYDTVMGEFRVHYAGFFDPGFGYDDSPGHGPGARAVLEVRSYNVPFVLEHGRVIGWLRFEKLAAPPDRLYGGAVGSSYQGQGLKLGKQFLDWPSPRTDDGAPRRGGVV